MPRFAFGKRKSTAGSERDLAAPSFRVLDRSEVLAESNGKSFHGGANLSAKTHSLPRTTVSDISLADNIFADYKPNYRYVVFFAFLRLPFQLKKCSSCARDPEKTWLEPRLISHKGCQSKFTVSQTWNQNGA